MTHEQRQCVTCGKPLSRSRVTGKCGRCVKLGRKFSPETRAKMSASHMGNTNALGKKYSQAFKNATAARMMAEANLRWAGDAIGYSGLHTWISRLYGPASRCENRSCEGKGKRYEWANISGEYRRDRNDFLELCSSCHRRWDIGLIEMEVVRG